jgi:hypothetical protein
MSGHKSVSPAFLAISSDSVFNWKPLDVVDHHELDLHVATLQFQP